MSMKKELRWETFTVPAIRAHKVNVYEPQPLYSGVRSNERQMFGVPVYQCEIPDDLLGKLYVTRAKPPKYPRPCAWAKNTKRPEVICNDVDWLARELQRLDARNLPHNRVFDGRELTCTAIVLPMPDYIRLVIQEHRPEAELMLYLQTVEFTL